MVTAQKLMNAWEHMWCCGVWGSSYLPRVNRGGRDDGSQESMHRKILKFQPNGDVALEAIYIKRIKYYSDLTFWWEYYKTSLEYIYIFCLGGEILWCPPSLLSTDWWWARVRISLPEQKVSGSEIVYKCDAHTNQIVKASLVVPETGNHRPVSPHIAELCPSDAMSWTWQFHEKIHNSVEKLLQCDHCWWSIPPVAKMKYLRWPVTEDLTWVYSQVY